jgi:hypothetical protein
MAFPLLDLRESLGSGELGAVRRGRRSEARLVLYQKGVRPTGFLQAHDYARFEALFNLRAQRSGTGHGSGVLSALPNGYLRCVGSDQSRWSPRRRWTGSHR